MKQKLNKRIINIGQIHQMVSKLTPHIYAVQKSALDKANEQLFYQGVDTCVVRFGYIDTPRVEHVDDKKMSVDYACQVIFWILRQSHRVKELTVCP